MIRVKDLELTARTIRAEYVVEHSKERRAATLPERGGIIYVVTLIGVNS